ncbi:NAD(P)-dependent oxidoreductase [Chitinophaga sp. 22321]|uniref:NAD(P)-dependent oxidoreductase n=1 Tax=Chitinophaga hostae TaxID=2831022 RepID=A0ABS5JAD2_9BACT|nr:NAD(P)-binding domain-containing protein [Chitinophaga hostae]MBS0032163.1 NAD(P)-dependent oxidoreductase [Chitinophaga hostae]
MTADKKVSVIGLGPMGAVLARTLLHSGYKVTVWNRTMEKAAALVQDGAVPAENPAAAVQASSVIITCLNNYAATRSVLETGSAAGDLGGRLLLELTTGTPQDARDAEVWANSLGAAYLDGALLATPRQIGKPDTPIFLAGSADAYQQGEAVLKVLGGNLMYMGTAAGAAAAWDLSLLSGLFGLMAGFLQGARIFESEKLPVYELGNMIQLIAPVLGEMVRHEGVVISNNDFTDPQSSLQTCMVSMALMVRQAKEAGITNEVPQFLHQLLHKGIKAGYGEEQLGALIKAMR